jgi:hypothetical protein
MGTRRPLILQMVHDPSALELRCRFQVFYLFIYFIYLFFIFLCPYFKLKQLASSFQQVK